MRGTWTYLYRAVDRDGQTLEFMLSENRDTATARRFFNRAVGTNGVPERITIDKSGANLAGLQNLSVTLKFTGVGRDRGRAHDPQGPNRANWNLSIQAVFRTRWIIVSTKYRPSSVEKFATEPLKPFSYQRDLAIGE